MNMTQLSVPNEQDIVLVENHFALMLEHELLLAESWLKLLPAYAPLLKTLLQSDSDKECEANKVLTAMISVVQNLRHPAILKEYFQTLEEHYFEQADLAEICAQFEASWQALLLELSDNEHSAALTAAWQHILAYLQTLMLSLRQEQAAQAEHRAERPQQGVAEADTAAMITASNAENKSSTDLGPLLQSLDDTLFQNNLLAFNLTIETNRPELADPKLQHLATDMRQATQQAMQLILELRQRLNK